MILPSTRVVRHQTTNENQVLAIHNSTNPTRKIEQTLTDGRNIYRIHRAIGESALHGQGSWSLTPKPSKPLLGLKVSLMGVTY